MSESMEITETSDVNRYFNYVVTAHPPSAVFSSICCSFTGNGELNLLVNKCTRIEVFLYRPDEEPYLHLVTSIPLYGRIATMNTFTPQGETQDRLVITTEKYNFIVLRWSRKKKQPETLAAGDVKEMLGRPVENGQMAMVDPLNRLIGLHLYDGMLKIVALKPNGEFDKEFFNLRVDEFNVLDMVFLDEIDAPTVAILYQDTNEGRHVAVYSVKMSTKELVNVGHDLNNLDASSHKLFPLPRPIGGFLIFAENSITFCNNKRDIKSISINMTVKSVCLVDQNRTATERLRLLFADQWGHVYVLSLHFDKAAAGPVLNNMIIQLLGKASVCSSISYISEGLAFLGSAMGDSSLVRLTTTPVGDPAEGNYLSHITTFDNIGPICDFCVVDLERQGQGQVVTCSGAFQDGSLRVVRNGIGIVEKAVVDLPGVKGLWAVKDPFQTAPSPCHDYIVLSFIGQTSVMKVSGEEMEMADIRGLKTEETLLCRNVAGHRLLQVSTHCVTLLGPHPPFEWTPAQGSTISLASANDSQVAVVTGGGSVVVVLEITPEGLCEVNYEQLEGEVSCVSVAALHSDDHLLAASKWVAVGLWGDSTVRILSLPGLQQAAQAPLASDVIPRDVLLATFETTDYALIAHGDGALTVFAFDRETGALSGRRKVTLASQPVHLNTFSSRGTQHVFAASDRPAVLFSNNNKLLFSNVNLQGVTAMAPLNTSAFPDCLALLCEDQLVIGSVDEIQKIHVKTIPLGEMPRRIAHCEASHTYLVGTLRVQPQPCGNELEASFFRLFDDSTFEVLSSYALDENETCCSVIQTRVEGVEGPVYVCGTAYALPQEPEPRKGRVLILAVKEGKLALVGETEVRGAVYSLAPFPTGRVVAGVNSIILLLKMGTTETGLKRLEVECSHHGHILALYIDTRNEFVVVGDLMKSVCLLTYTSEGILEEIARDYAANWMTGVIALDDVTYLGGENSFNIFTVARNTDSAQDEDRGRLDLVGSYHLGEFVNRFRHGSLVMQSADGAARVPCVLYGTINGVIGVIASLPKNDYLFLEKVQQRMSKVVFGVGGLKHTEWRAFSNERKTKQASHFLDGDLIEKFLDLSLALQRRVVEDLGISVDDLKRTIEDLSLLH
eukprot:GCRY01001253.1.p1 GENE.GCRY01001253.1~~GCRY01001253.1.p1  ORF type:complete len:1121 (+),score=337.54 GCRY01001253.1:198-3560(+)